MKGTPCLYLLLLYFLFASCEWEVKQNISITQKTEPHFLMTSTGDSIPTGAPIPARGKWLHPGSVDKPVIIPLRGKPHVVPAYNNAFPAGTPEVVHIPKNLTVTAPGKNGVPVPKSVPARGKVVPAVQPQPIPALPLQRNDPAFAGIRILDVEQGMNSSRIRSILEDSRGNLWFGTFDNGVTCYDGSQFFHYTMAEGLSFNTVWSILEDSRGNLWFGTRGGGLNRYDGKSFTHFTTKEGLSNDIVWSMLEDSRGNIWISTWGGVNRYTPSESGTDGTFTHFTTNEGLIGDQIRCMLEDSQGDLWFGTNNKGVSRFDPETNNGQGSFTQYTIEEGLISNELWTIHEDNDGDLWFGTGEGVSRFDPGANNGQGSFTNYTKTEGLSQDAVISMLIDRHGDLWFGTNGKGLSRFDPEANNGQGRFIHYATEEGLSNGIIGSMLEDSQGNIWIGTWGGGVNLYRSSSFIHYNEESGLSDNDVWSILEDSHGNLWFGTYSGEVNKYDPLANNGQGGFTHYTAENGFNFKGVRSILEDNQGNLWFGTDQQGAIKFDGTRFSYYNKESGLSGNIIMSNLKDSRGNLWFGTEGGVSRVNPETMSFVHYTEEGGLGCPRISSVSEDDQGNLWFATEDSGVTRFAPEANNGQGSFIHYGKEEGFSDIGAKTSVKDSEGNLWFGTFSGGVIRFDPTSNNGQGSFIQYTTDEGLIGNKIRSIIEDRQKNLWIGTNKGLSVMVPVTSGFSSATDSEADAYKFFTFDTADGLRRSNFIYPHCVYLDSQNRLWWGPGNGLIMLDLNQFELPVDSPRIRLNSIAIERNFIDFRRLSDATYRQGLSFGEILVEAFDSVVPFYNYPTRIALPHDLNHLTFQFSAIDWAGHHKVKYSYLMEGLEKQWSHPASATEADYRSLPPGDYIFKVKAIGSAQVWSEPFEYHFCIRPPWWLTWWSYSLYLILIITTLSALYRFQLNRQLARAETRRLQELDQAKTRLYTNISHEFRTPLTIILGLSDQLKAQASEGMKSGLDMVERNGRRLLRLVNQMLDLRKLEVGKIPVHWIQGDIIQYLKYIQESFHSLAENKNIRLHFLSDFDTLHMDFDPDKLSDIISNLLANALRYSPDGGDVYITVDGGWSSAGVESNGSSLLIKVKDNGAGIPDDKLPHIFDRFFQADDSFTRKAEGTGIGLALTRELVKLLEGEISVKSSLGKGSEFILRLPIRNSAEAQPAYYGGEITSRDGYSLLGSSYFDDSTGAGFHGKEETPLVLIVEDHPDLTQYLVTCLQKKHRLISATDGQEGIDKALREIPDLIICDIMMPEKDGFEVCRTLKNEERTSHIPIVLLTARADMESKLYGLECGADAYLPKPFQKDELLVRIHKLLELRRQLQRHYRSLAGPEEINLMEQDTVPVKESEHAFVQRVRAKIERNLHDPGYNVDSLCRGTGMSQPQLYRKLSALAGCSPHQFIRFLRLSKAKVLLQDSDLTIAAVAYDTGFADPNYFSRVFREEFGMAPSEFRERKKSL